MRARGLLVALVVPLALLSACGGDSDSTAADPADSASATTSASDTPSESPSDTPSESATDSATASPVPPDWPACDSVWTKGGKIPKQYKGCLDGSDEVPADNLACSSGQRIVRYQDTFFGVAGGTIYKSAGPLNKDKQYLEMVGRCRA
jgi:hypothetical protein